MRVFSRSIQRKKVSPENELFFETIVDTWLCRIFLDVVFQKKKKTAEVIFIMKIIKQFKNHLVSEIGCS